MQLSYHPAPTQNPLSSLFHPAQQGGPGSESETAAVAVSAHNYYLNTEYRVINLTGDVSTYGYIYYASLYAGPSYIWLVLVSLLAMGAIISNSAAIVMHITAICYTRNYLYKSSTTSRPHPMSPASNFSTCGATSTTPVVKQLYCYGRRLGCPGSLITLLAWCWKAGIRLASCHPCRRHKANNTVVNKSVLTSDVIVPIQAAGHLPNAYATSSEHSPVFPGVSIIKPLVGVDYNLEVNLLAYFKLEYPLYEILFCVASAEDPVCDIVQRLQQSHPSVDSRLLITSECFGVNPKVNNLQAGYEVTQYELILISDSGVWMRPDTLTDMVLILNADPRVGMVHQVPFMTPHACSFGHQDTGYMSELGSNQYPSKHKSVAKTDVSNNAGNVTYLNSVPSFSWVVQQVYFGCWHARLYLNAALFGINCTSGMSCLLRKYVLYPCGGFKAFSCYIAEDYFLATYFLKNGWLIRISHQPAWQNSPCHSLEQFLSRIIRWSQLRKTMTLVTYVIEPVTRCLPNALMGALAFAHLLPGRIDPGVYFMCYTLSWFLLDYILLCSMYPPGQPVCITKLEYLIAWCFWEITAVPFHYSSVFSRELTWRNRRFLVHWGGYSEQLSPKCKPKRELHSRSHLEGPLLAV